MTAITQDELLADFDAILDRVIAGEYFLIDGETSGGGCVLMPYIPEIMALIGDAHEP
jgi:hypothetical protein